jgi:B9 domain-containing protein 1
MTGDKNEESRFELVIAGELESATFLKPLPCASVSFSFSPAHSADWCVSSGDTMGVSARAHSSYSQLVLNVPFTCTFASTNPSGWPRICITVLSKDMLGRDVIIGYGSAAVPCQTGRHVREIHLYAPTFRSVWWCLMNWAFGKRPVLNEPIRFLTDPHIGERDGVVTEHIGATVKINFNVSLLNTHKFCLFFYNVSVLLFQLFQVCSNVAKRN